jgi:hypothetical protein
MYVREGGLKSSPASFVGEAEEEGGKEGKRKREKKEGKRGEKRQLILYLLRQYLSPGSEKYTKRKQTAWREAPPGWQKKRKMGKLRHRRRHFQVSLCPLVRVFVLVF